MKAPRCRLCSKEHYGLCKNIGEPVAAAQSPKLRPGGSTPPTFANAPSSNGRTAGLGPVNAGSNPAGATKAFTSTGETIPEKFHRKAAELGFRKLTQAEKQKKYREKGGAGLRERERLRMAAKRKELKGA